MLHDPRRDRPLEPSLTDFAAFIEAKVAIYPDATYEYIVPSICAVGCYLRARRGYRDGGWYEKRHHTPNLAYLDELAAVTPWSYAALLQRVRKAMRHEDAALCA